MQPDFDAVVDWLVAVNLPLDPAEFQGILLGRLSGAAMAPLEDHVAALLGECLEAPSSEASQGLSRWCQSALEALKAGDFESTLPFSDDTLILEHRLESLAAWSRGFLYGVGSAALPQALQKDPEIEEMLTDLQAISTVGLGNTDEPSVDQEAAYEAILEHLKLIPHALFHITSLFHHQRIEHYDD